MADERKRLTLEELDAMSSAERAAVIEAHYAQPSVIITDLGELPPKIRARVPRDRGADCQRAFPRRVIHRQVRVAQSFFDRLDTLLPDERLADGTPSTADFLFP